MDQRILEIIRKVQAETSNSFGYRKMVAEVSTELGVKVNAKRVYRIMGDNGLLSAVRRRRYSDEVYLNRRMMKQQVPPDLIRRDFFSLCPRIRFTEDITYLPAIEGNLYLNMIMDLYNDEIVAWSISEHVDTQLCIDTVRKLAARPDVSVRGIILHSDAGSTYCSYAYVSLLSELGIQRSMGRTAVCYDNAAQESLNGIIKTEALYCRFGKTKVKTGQVPREDLVKAVAEFIAFYNERRPKKRLGNRSPREFIEENPRGTYPMKID